MVGAGRRRQGSPRREVATGHVSYVARRLLLSLVTLFGITVVTFAIIAMAPGDPVPRPDDLPGSDRVYKEMRKRLHLDEPIHVRYGLWLRDVVTGKSRSIADERPVIDKIKAAFWPTVSVNLVGLALAFALAIPIGIASAARHNGTFDRLGGAVLYALYSIPSYVGAIVIILFVSVKWDLLPFRGMRSDDYATLDFFGRTWDLARHMAIYVVCVTYGSLAYYARFVRTNMLEVVRQDFIRTARAKGLDERTVVVRHAFRNTMIPFLTLLGLTFPVVISGSVILEVIFTWPGLGRLFVESIFQRDFPVVMALSTATAIMVLFGTLLADLMYGVVDPRVRYD